MVKKRVGKANGSLRSKGKLNLNKLTLGQRLADRVTAFGGSWTFIIIIVVFLVTWVVLNGFWLAKFKVWDPYPFILLNLILACLVTLQAPIILMSHRRQQERDRIKFERDYMINRKAEREVEIIQKELKIIKRMISGKKGKR